MALMESGEQKDITVTVESGYTLGGNNVTQVGNLVAGGILITHGYDALPTGEWIKIGNISKSPAVSDYFQYKTVALNGSNGTVAGMAEINTSGEIKVFLTTAAYNIMLNVAYKTN